MLIDAGADMDVVDTGGMTPLCAAAENKHDACTRLIAVHVLSRRALLDNEWDLVPHDFEELGSLLHMVMVRDGRDASAKLVSRLPVTVCKNLENAALCLSHTKLPHDVVDRILSRCI
jgi:ankyrin repeat protein